MNKLVVTKQAYQDIDLIIEYIANSNKIAANNVLKVLQKSIYMIVEFPNIGILRPDFTYKNVMFYVVAKRYIIAYQVNNTEILILRVLSAYQDICSLF